ncbi:MAG: CapA family protein [Crocinitomicaceae bacterium]|nr:CapA family protein [Crocinitomicaceae bacterium]
MNLSITIHTRTLKVLSLCSIFFSLSFLSFSQDNEVSMLFVGDVMGHDGQINAAFNKTTNSYEYEDAFKFVKPILNEYDLRIANLEVTLAGKPYKGYPQFSSPDDLPETLINTGFNIILTSNNHSCDRGSKGVARTLDKLDELGVAHTGTFRNQAERDRTYPLMVKKNGMKIAMLNYTYGTNGLSVAKPLIVNYIDSNVIKADVLKAKERGAEYIICNMHWGSEYKLLPNNYQKTYEKLCYRIGVDMVIGGHPHVVQPIVKKEINGEDKLTVWSLGNFVSNMQIRHTRGGVMVGATIKKKDNKITLEEVKHHIVYVLAKQEGATKPYYILPDFDYNKFRLGFLGEVDIKRMKLYFSDARKLYAEENAGNEESIVSEESPIGQLYIKFLTQYYSVLLPKTNDDILMDPNLGAYLHETLRSDGSNAILSGVCSTKEQAAANLSFIKDCGMAEAKIVLVKPGKIEIIE